jgi:two-component system sensor histidine kinase KdpD
MSAEILAFAHRRNVTKIVMGKPNRTGWQRWLLGSVVDNVVGEASDLDVYLFGSAELQSVPDEGQSFYLNRSRLYLGLGADEKSSKQRWPGYLAAVAMAVAVSALVWPLHDVLQITNLVMIYLLGVTFIAGRYGRGPSLLASVLSVISFDFFFVPPFFSFAIADTEYLVTFSVMLIVALTISGLTANARSQAKVAGYRERRIAALYAMSKELAASRGVMEIVQAAVRHIGTEFESQTVILLPGTDNKLVYPMGASLPYSLHGADLSVAQWVLEHQQIAGRGTDTLPGTEATYFPLQGATGSAIGVLAILPVNLRRVFLPEQQRLMDAFINQIVQAIERVRLADQAKLVQIQAETESLRNSLLSAISHDLRTPLAAIVGASSSLVDGEGKLDVEARRELSSTIYDEAQRMTSLANNILDMARLDAGSVRLNVQWVPIEEIVGGVLTRFEAKLAGRPLRTDIAPDLPLLKLDAVMIEQVMVNLLENALKYTPAASPLEVRAVRDDKWVTVSVTDHGSGLAQGSEERLFDKFFRGEREPAQSGVGLGLAICRAIVSAHGGRIWAENTAHGGARFSFTLPLHEMPPAVEPEEQ